MRLVSVTFELPVYATDDRTNLHVIDIAPNYVAQPIHIRVVPGLNPGTSTGYYDWLRYSSVSPQKYRGSNSK